MSPRSAGVARPGRVLLAVLAALAGASVAIRRRQGAAIPAPQTDAVDREVQAALDTAEPDLRFPPVVIVIAAYNEADGLPGVLAALPREVCGLAAEVLVVDDGSSDGTAEAVRSAGRERGGVSVLACRANRGQGRALRLGYRVARLHGASYIVTTDADGQYAPEEIERVLGPVVAGQADFVSGSRRLGTLENRDAVRQAGTYVFAWLASALLGQRITDTSFGLRAMRAEVTAAVTLDQPQYQASELLVGVFAHGFRYAEVPATMRVRSAGASKKGGNLVYGSRYARVLLGTWWREGCPRLTSTSRARSTNGSRVESPLAPPAPALRDSSRDEPVDQPG